MTCKGVIVSGVLLVAALIPCANKANADACLQDIWDNGGSAVEFVYPNWTRVLAASYDASVWMGYAGTEMIRAITVVNFGSATNADIKAVYCRVHCPTVDTGLLTMTWAGNFVEDSGTHPAWTWAGATGDFSVCAPLWALGPVGFTIDVYVDIGPCPTAGNVVEMGLPINTVSNPIWPGSVLDNQGCMGPWWDLKGGRKTIIYSMKKTDNEFVAPGDTATYSIYYGKPGTANLTGIQVIDSLPPYTHFVDGSGSPAPLPGWDPNPGPPSKLLWNIPGPLPVAGGPTGLVTFQLTVDWGNGESFEPGSGDVAAPEGERLQNRAQIFFNGIAGCGNQTVITPPVSTVIRRYLFWKLADNDILFAGRMGSPDDEITFSIFVRNVSETKTWWNVNIWDSVPVELDVWEGGFGFDDLCVGWTITPTGCTPALAGKTVSGGTTVLTWNLDMPPGMTIELRWKARVKPSTSSGSTAVGIASIMELGRSGVVDGTGHAGLPRRFAHVAPIVLRTTYISYAGIAGAGAGTCGIFITFYPLNRAANFELRAIEAENDVWANTGGVSASIGTFIGSCLGGFFCPGSAGCGAERRPADYSRWENTCAPNSGHICPAQPYHFIYKVLSNSPVLWMVFSDLNSDALDQQTYLPTTSLSYSGLISYSFLRRNRDSASNDYGDAVNIINTSIDSFGVFSSVQTTSVLVFKWNPNTVVWDFIRMVDIGPESQWASEPVHNIAEQGHYRFVSSDTKLVIRQECLSYGPTRGYNNYAHLAPTAENGTLVSKGTGNTFYVFPGGRLDQQFNSMTIGNVGATTATYRIEKYEPDNPLDRPPVVPMWMGGTSGKWQFITRDTVPSGQGTAGNPHVYGTAYDATVSFATPDGMAAMWRVIHESGGAIEINSGLQVMSVYGGGSLVHASDGRPVGTDFWVFSPWNWIMSPNHCDIDSSLMWVQLFCSKTGMAIQATSNDGYSAHYTTTGPDQCVAFGKFTDIALGAHRNYRFQVLAGGAQGDIIAMYNMCQPSHKFFTAPFLETGVHYEIIAPPVAYIGQSFWITVVVVDSGGGTKTDYTGTTSFTSTDPAGKIQSVSMDIYNYAWPLADAGVRVFINVVFTRMGMQSISASDTLDGSITGLATVMVVAADVKLEKRKRLSVAASGDTVQFWLCWSNYSSATAYSFTITDAVPNGTSYVPEIASTTICGQNGPFNASVSMAASTSTATTPPTNFATVNPGSTAGATTRWLRWTVRDVYVNSSGCVCFKVVVN